MKRRLFSFSCIALIIAAGEKSFLFFLRGIFKIPVSFEGDDRVMSDFHRLKSLRWSYSLRYGKSRESLVSRRHSPVRLCFLVHPREGECDPLHSPVWLHVFLPRHPVPFLFKVNILGMSDPPRHSNNPK